MDYSVESLRWVFRQLSSKVSIGTALTMYVVFKNLYLKVSRLLDSKHGKHYLVFNLSDRDYDYSYFGNRVIVCGFPDHHSPPIALMWAIYSFIDLWMAVSPDNVISAHCLAGWNLNRN